MADRDALVQAVLDALNETDLRAAADEININGWENVELAMRLDAAADSLHALREAES